MPPPYCPFGNHAFEARRTRADGPRRAWPAACPPDRGSAPWEPPSSAARRRARAGSRSAGGSPRASGRRTTALRLRLARDFSARLGGEAEVALGPIFLQCHGDRPAAASRLTRVCAWPRSALVWRRGNRPPRAAPVSRASRRPCARASLAGAPPSCRGSACRRSARSMTCAERGCFVLVLAGLGDLLGLSLLDLLLDARHEVVVVRVLELARLPMLGHVVDEALGELRLPSAVTPAAFKPSAGSSRPLASRSSSW